MAGAFLSRASVLCKAALWQRATYPTGEKLVKTSKEDSSTGLPTLPLDIQIKQPTTDKRKCSNHKCAKVARAATHRANSILDSFYLLVNAKFLGQKRGLTFLEKDDI